MQLKCTADTGLIFNVDGRARNETHKHNNWPGRSLRIPFTVLPLTGRQQSIRNHTIVLLFIILDCFTCFQSSRPAIMFAIVTSWQRAHLLAASFNCCPPNTSYLQFIKMWIFRKRRHCRLSFRIIRFIAICWGELFAFSNGLFVNCNCL